MNKETVWLLYLEVCYDGVVEDTIQIFKDRDFANEAWELKNHTATSGEYWVLKEVEVRR